MILTKEQIQSIRESRERNYSYAAIAAALDLSINTVKSYGYRHGMNSPKNKKTISVKDSNLRFCRWCGKVLESKGRNLYCSKECRIRWHNNQNMGKAKNVQK